MGYGEEYGLQDSASCYVAMHPDEATCDVVDAALQRGIPFAVVPCCVFSEKFPDRHLSSGQQVTSYDFLLQFIIEKDSRIQKAQLPFLGRNTVLFMCSSSDC